MNPEEGVEKFGNLVHWVASKYYGFEDLEDLVQIGFVGLIIGLKTYDPSKSRVSYLISHIQGAILNFLRDHGHLFKISRFLPRDQVPEAPSSFSIPLGPSYDLTLEDLLGTEDPEFQKVDLKLEIEHLVDIANLSYKEQYVLKRFYWDDLSQAAIARELNYSQMHISRIKREAVRKLSEQQSNL